MAWITASAGPAEAHPVLIGAEPASGSVLSRTPARVHLAFSEPIEPAGAEVQLNTADGQTLFRGGNSRPSVLELRPESLGSALYEVRYEALGRDGHFVSGTYRFAVWPPGTPRPEGLDEVARETGGPGPQGRARGIAIALSVPLAGLLLASAVLEGRGRRSRRVLVVICAAGILAGDAFAIEASGRAVLSTTFGRLVAAHALLAVAAGAVALRPPPPPASTARRLRSGLGGLLMLPVTLTGHNVALAKGAASAAALDWLHLVSASMWIGGVVHILTPGTGDPGWRDQIRRFGPVAVVSGILAVFTGTIASLARVHRLRAFLDTPYGRTLAVKIALVAVVAGLGLLARLLLDKPGRSEARHPLLTAALVGDRLLSVLVTPYRPGANTVRVAPGRYGVPDAAGAGQPPVIAVVDDGVAKPLTRAPGWEGRLQLPKSGVVQLRIDGGEGQVWETSLDPRPGRAVRIASVISLDGPGAEECRSRLAGQLVAVQEANVDRKGKSFALHVVETMDAGNAGRSLTPGRPAALAGVCPGTDILPTDLAKQLGVPPPPADPLAEVLDPATAGRIFGSFLSERGVKRAALVVDPSGRATALAEAFAAETAPAGVQTVVLPPERASEGRDAQAIVVAAGWDTTRSVLATARSEGWRPERGLFLAPWLLHAGILDSAIGAPSQVAVGLAVNPVSDGARHYLAALGALAPTETPTIEGLRGYLEARVAMAVATGNDGAAVVRAEGGTTAFPGGPAVRKGVRIQFYVPTNVEILPAFLHGGHGTSAHLWLGDAAWRR